MPTPPLPDALPILPLRTKVLFPGEMSVVAVDRAKSVAAIESVLASAHPMLVVVAQQDPSIDDPQPAQLFTVGTTATIGTHTRLERGIRVELQGAARVAIGALRGTEPFLLCAVSALGGDRRHAKAATFEHAQKLVEPARERLSTIPEVPSGFLDMLAMVAEQDPSAFADMVAGAPLFDVAARQRVLETADIDARLALLESMLGAAAQH